MGQQSRRFMLRGWFLVVFLGLGIAPVAEAAVTISVGADPQILGSGVLYSTITWGLSNVPFGTMDCTLSGGGNSWSYHYPGSPSAQLVNRPSQNTTYTVHCSGQGSLTGQSWSVTGSVRLIVSTALSFTANPEVLGDGVLFSTLSWIAENATSCSAYGGWAGGKPVSGSELVSRPPVNTTYSMSCTGPLGNAAKSVTLYVGSTVLLSANPPVVDPGQSSTLSWTATNVSSCSASGGWSGDKPASGTEAVTPSTQTLYKLICNTFVGTVSQSVTVAVRPTLDFNALPAAVAPGATSTLTWSAQNATSCAASNGWSGAKPISGSEVVSPARLTSYDLTCTGPGGTVTRSVQVSLPPPVSFSADRLKVLLGRYVTLTWSSSYATSCTAFGDWSGDKPLNGSEVTAALSKTSGFGLSCTWEGGTTTQTVRVAVVRPNFLVILSDDQRYDTLNHNVRTYMPQTYDFFEQQGVWFDNAYVTTPLCCPSRSSILTGMYAKDHGVTQNEIKLKQTTIAQRLQAHGYDTALIGKYLNSWFASDPPPSGFTRWVTFQGGGLGSYYNYTLFDNDGPLIYTNQYITTVLGQRAISFLHSTTGPFFLFFTPNAPHAPAQPAPADVNLYTNLPLHRLPSFNEPDKSDKPVWLQPFNLSATQIADSDAFRMKQLRTLAELDRQVAALIRELALSGRLDNTVVIYLSDNGYFWGEHSLEGKRRVYEEASRVPFALRLPLLTGPRVDNHLVANIDIAATMYDLAGIPMPPEIAGLSLAKLLEGTTPWRDSLFIEGFGGTDTLRQTSPPYQAIHTDRYVYVETDGDNPELYDLVADPYQLNSKVNDPAYASVRDVLASKLHGRCHVLTAAFGRPDAPEIIALWQFHRWLVPYWSAPWHRAYLAWYDRHGPALAAGIARRPYLSAAIRCAVTPLARVAQWWIAKHPDHSRLNANQFSDGGDTDEEYGRLRYRPSPRIRY